MIKINKYMAVITLFYTGVSLATKPSGDLVVSTTSLGKVARRIGRRGPSHLKLLQDVKSLKAIVQQFSEVPLKSLQGKRDLKLNLDPVFGIPSNTLADYIDSVPALTTPFQSLPLVIKLQILELCKSNEELPAVLLQYFLANGSLNDFLKYFLLLKDNLERRTKLSSKVIKIFIDNDIVPEHFTHINAWNSKNISVFYVRYANQVFFEKWNPDLGKRIENMISRFQKAPSGQSDYLYRLTINDLSNFKSKTEPCLKDKHYSLSQDENGSIIITNKGTNNFMGKFTEEDIKFLETFLIQVQPF